MIAKNLVHAACASSPVDHSVSQLLVLPFFKEIWSTDCSYTKMACMYKYLHDTLTSWTSDHPVQHKTLCIMLMFSLHVINSTWGITAWLSLKYYQFWIIIIMYISHSILACLVWYTFVVNWCCQSWDEMTSWVLQWMDIARYCVQIRTRTNTTPTMQRFFQDII